MKKLKGKMGPKVKKSKVKRWKKGHSSDSNPEGKKYRLAAKNRFFNESTGPSDLTEAALAQHNEAHEDGLSDTAMDVASTGGNTFNTWATNWTECTNTTFSKVHRYWQSNSAQHKEILAVLAAVTEVIKSKGGKETETEYFGALMTALETMEGDETLGAVAYLLSLAIKRVPHAVLKLKFSNISKALVDILGKHATSNGTSLLRSLLLCLASVLRVQDQSVWINASTLQVYHALLSFVGHSKPKVRKAAQQSVRAILKGSNFMTVLESPPHHPAASVTAKYCIQQIEECGGTGEAHGTMYTLELLKDTLGVFPKNSLKSCCETILRVMTLSNVLMTSVCMRCLHGMFIMQPKSSTLPAELNAQLIMALYDYQPGENDVQPMAAWLAVMERAHIHLAGLDGKLCVSHLPRFFGACMTAMLSEKADIQFAVAKTLKAVLNECVVPTTELLISSIKNTAKGQSSPIHKMFKSVESGLSYQYHAAWGLVLQVIAIFFQTIGKQCHSIMKKCLLSLADLRDSHSFPYKGELDHAVSMAIKSMGPKIVLSAIPLQITGENDDYSFPRSWVLPLLRENIENTELLYFAEYFLPLAARLRSKALEFSENNRQVESKTYDALQSQIWSLLPGFCNQTTDLSTSFPQVAKILGSALTDRPDIRYDVLSSLRKLIHQNLEHAENKEVLAKFSKNFLPLLFNLFTAETDNEKDPKRQSILETIKCYLQITDPTLIATYFEKCVEKLKEEDCPAFRRHALLDLAMAEVHYVKKNTLKKLFTYVFENLENTVDHTVQKKCYRNLEELCSSSSVACKKFVNGNLQEIQNLLLKSLSSSSASSKGPRLKCLIHIITQSEDAQMDFISAVVPEAILCTKEPGEKARQNAYKLLVEMGNSIMRWTPDLKDEALTQYFQVVLAGLAGSPHMVSATELALTRILYEFKGQINDILLGCIVENTCVLLSSKAREIVNSALSLLKVVLKSFSDTKLAVYLKQLVSSLVSMKDDNKHHFRFRSKEIFIKLIRKFGFENIHSLVPQSHHKLLANIRKTQERTKRKKDAAKLNEDDDSEEEDFKPIKPKPERVEDLLRDTDSEDDGDDKTSAKKKKSVKGSAWLKEGGTEDIVDFLDSSVSKKVLATRPDKGQVGKKGVKHDFKKAPDGRFIFSANADEAQQNRGKKAEPDIDDIDELLDALGGHKKNKKRKHNPDELGDDDEEAPLKYKAGGSGIHRPLAVPIKHKEPTEPGAEYRSKKAKGDMKKSGKPDPFAYIPLDMKNLNRRKRAKAAGQFKNLVKGAKKGAVRGNKMKKK